jgi:hypothetical protein
METTKEEYQAMYQRIDQLMQYTENKHEFITTQVEKHFAEFLNKAEQDAITTLIIQNYKENHGYSGDGILPNGNLLCWEIQVIACNWSDKTIIKSHMDKWYTPEYCTQIANIIKTKKL